MRLLLLAIWLLLAPGLGAGAAWSAEASEGPERPTIYKWVDENGIAHYTTDRERIPRGLRDRFDRPAARTPARPAPRPAPDASLEAAIDTPEGLAPRTATKAPTPLPVVESPPSEAWSRLDRGAAPDPPPAGDASETAGTDDRVAERDLRAESDFMATEPGGGGDLEARIALLEAEIQADEEALKALLAAPPGEAPLAVADDVDLRAIAERLPERLYELDALRGQRGTP